jgi:transposase-like protein
MRAAAMSPKEGTTMTDVTETAKRLRRAAAAQERWHAERDELIRQARAEGMGVREIARQVGMTHPGVLAILARDQDAEPAGV